jgi:hypothetical protein
MILAARRVDSWRSSAELKFQGLFFGLPEIFSVVGADLSRLLLCYRETVNQISQRSSHFLSGCPL